MSKKNQKIKARFSYVADGIDEEIDKLIKDVITAGRSYIKEEDKFVGSGFNFREKTRDIEYELDIEDLEHMCKRYDLH